MGKRIARVIGYILCGIMLVLCIALIFVSAAFSAEETVNIFGVNIYVVNEDGITTVPKGSAVIVNSCKPYEVDAGKLVMYKNDEKLSLGYGKGYSVVDGVYRVTVIDNNTEFEISENNLIGKADYCSEFLGSLISFVKSQMGVLVLAIIPCLVLIVYDIIRAAALRRPLPEVVPQVKNKEEPRYSERGISVNSEGKGTYSRTAASKPASAASDVLFTYTARQTKSERPAEKRNTPIIPLTDKPVSKTETSAKPKNAGALRSEPVSENTAKIKTVPTFLNEETKKTSTTKKDDTIITSKVDQGDAFFTQTSIPQIQKSAYFRSIMNNNAEKDKNEEKEDEPVRPQKTSSKRSTEIIANKRVEDLILDDDDIRDKSRYNDADDIVMGFNKKV